MILVARVIPERSQLNSSVAWGLLPFSRKWRSTVVIKDRSAMALEIYSGMQGMQMVSFRPRRRNRTARNGDRLRPRRRERRRARRRLTSEATEELGLAKSGRAARV